MLKNALKLGTLLTKAEAKKIVAGSICPPGFVMCPDGLCVPYGEECNGGSVGCVKVWCTKDPAGEGEYMGEYSYCPSEQTDTVCPPDDGVRCKNC